MRMATKVEFSDRVLTYRQRLGLSKEPWPNCWDT